MVIDLGPWLARIRRLLGRESQVGSEIRVRVEALLDTVAGEASDERLWATLRGRIADEILMPLWRDGRLQGTKPEEAYFVRCDRSTMTQADLDAGRLVVLVGFASVRPAEFELLRIERATG